jgi:uncharacterized membrane protein YeaQ/YmgE (transglycosylase-associated protein family)
MIGWAFFGLIAGAVARMLHPGPRPVELGLDDGPGHRRRAVGGWIGDQMGFNTESGVMSFITAVAGAILLLVLYHLATGRRAAAAPGGPPPGDDYKKAVFDDLSRGPNG